MEQDIGRPLRFMAYNLINVDLQALCDKVAAKLAPVEIGQRAVQRRHRAIEHVLLQRVEQRPVGTRGSRGRGFRGGTERHGLACREWPNSNIIPVQEHDE